MYEYLEGRVVLREPTRIVLEVGGVGYDLAIPVGVVFPAPGERGANGDGVRVWTHFVVREDAHRLYGFPDPAMRELFRWLLKVRGVGPGLAQAILSSLPGEELLDAITAGKVRPLTRIKGVGKKTAEQILLDLKDRVPSAGELGAIGAQGNPPSAGEAEHDRLLADAMAALQSIGYTSKQAETSVEKAAKSLAKHAGELELESLVRAALTE